MICIYTLCVHVCVCVRVCVCVYACVRVYVRVCMSISNDTGIIYAKYCNLYRGYFHCKMPREGTVKVYHYQYEYYVSPNTAVISLPLQPV